MTAAVDVRFAEQVAFLKTLIRSPSENPPGDIDPFAETTAEALCGLGLDVERHPVAEPFVRQTGMRSVTNLIVRRRFGAGGPVIALNAHGDVVPAGEGWSVDPYAAEEHGGALYGRGTVFGKSDISAYTFALLALTDRPDGLNGTIELHLTCDEETGGTLGPMWIVGQDLSKPDYVIASGFNRVVTTAHNGCLQMEVILRGRAAHAATPASGVDALEAAMHTLRTLYEERDRLAISARGLDPKMRPTLTIGMIQGGLNTNVIPDRVMLRLDRRLTPQEVGEEVETALVERVQGALPVREGLEIECRRLLLAEPLRPVAGVGVLADAIHKHIEQWFPAAATPGPGSPLFSDARHYAAAGVPTVLYGTGPTSMAAANAYAADEHIRLDDLRATTGVLIDALRDLLGDGLR